MKTIKIEITISTDKLEKKYIFCELSKINAILNDKETLLSDFLSDIINQFEVDLENEMITNLT